MKTATPLLEVAGLRVDYPVRHGYRTARQAVVRDVGFHLLPGETLGFVGESGSGKTTIGNAILGLVEPAAGRIVFDRQDITHATPRQRRALSSRLQVVFQDPYGSLNPSKTIGRILAEPLQGGHSGAGRRVALARVRDVLAEVGLAEDALTRYPAHFSGGQRQRIAIARALVLRPSLIVCDEPTSALDLSVQAQVLNLLLDLQRQRGLSYLFISHDIDVVRYFCHRIAVLEAGEIVEQGPVADVTGQPGHPYTRRLLAAAPSPDPQAHKENKEEDASAPGAPRNAARRHEAILEPDVSTGTA